MSEHTAEFDHSEFGGLMWRSAQDLLSLSRWIDDGNPGRDREAATWGRLAKIAEESGEVIAAYIGYTGQNPRKGVTHTRYDVMDELLDVAITALGAYEHMNAHTGVSLIALAEKITAVAERAGVVVPSVKQHERSLLDAKVGEV